MSGAGSKSEKSVMQHLHPAPSTLHRALYWSGEIPRVQLYFAIDPSSRHSTGTVKPESLTVSDNVHCTYAQHN